jgi:His/Glu/Gln/Arg/opine family amino acid ABC transporter permease subunit
MNNFTSWFSYLWPGFIVTIELSAACSVTSILVGGFVAVMRIHPARITRVLGNVYVEVFRSIPLLALLLFIYYGLGHMALAHGIGAFWLGVIAITLSESAYLCEVYRAALQAVPAGQREAAESLGLTWWRIIQSVVIPQAIPPSLPTTVNAIVGIVKNSALASLIAISEATLTATLLVSSTFQPMSVYLCLTVMYLILLIPVSLIGKFLESKFGEFRSPRQAGRLSRRPAPAELMPEV